jgi:hypothetical protein
MRIIKQTRKPMLFKVVVTNKSKLSQLSVQAEVMPLASLKLKSKIRLKTSQTIYESQNKLANFFCNLYVVVLVNTIRKRGCLKFRQPLFWYYNKANSYER